MNNVSQTVGDRHGLMVKYLLLYQIIDVSVISSIEFQLNTYSHSRSTIDNITYSLQNIFQKAAQSAFSATSRQTTNDPNSTNKPWFWSKCKRLQDNYHRVKSMYAKNKTYTNKVNLKK